MKKSKIYLMRCQTVLHFVYFCSVYIKIQQQHLFQLLVYTEGENAVAISLRHFTTRIMKYISHDKKYLEKKIRDLVTLGTFCYRDQSFTNRRGSFFFT